MSLYKQIFATANFILAICGYQFVTTLFLPMSDDVEVATRMVTVPFRIVSLFVTIATIFLHLRNIQQIPVLLKLFLVYWGIMLCRILYDLNINMDIAVTESYKTFVYTWTLVCLSYTISTLLSFSSINFSVAFKACYILLLVTLLMTISGNEMMFEEVEGRLDGNVALNTISFGHTGVTLAILAMWSLFRSKGLLSKIFHFVVFAIGFFIMLRAGSRGPFVAMIGVIMFYMLSRIHNKVVAIASFIVVSLFLYINFEFILELIGQISPIMEQRLSNSIYLNDSSGRDNLMDYALYGIAEKPLLGKSFAIPQRTGEMYYPHNYFVEAFMSCGIIIGGMFVLLNLYVILASTKIIENKLTYGWLVLLFVQKFFHGMFSGAIYLNYDFSILMVINLILIYNMKHNANTNTNASLFYP